MIFICNGVCTVPDFPSYAEKYTKLSMHSHNYRKADIFQGKTIAVIGAGLSGTDICEQVAGYANKVRLLDSSWLAQKTLLADRRAPVHSIFYRKSGKNRFGSTMNFNLNQFLLDFNKKVEHVDLLAVFFVRVAINLKNIKS